MKKTVVIALIISLITLPSCNWFSQPSVRETILDKVVSIPDPLILDLPQLPPCCDDIPDLKKGFADIGDGKLYYEEEGQGLPLVLISGGPGCTHHVFHPYFSQIKDAAHVIYYDQRGTDKSSSDETGKTYTVKQAVEDLENLRKFLKIERWAVLGHSYGGLLAQCYALSYPQSCMAIILVASATGIADNTSQLVREKEFISQHEHDAMENLQKMVNEGKLTPAQSYYNKLFAGEWKRWRFYKPRAEEFSRMLLYNYAPTPGFEELMRTESDKKIPSSNLLKGKFDDCDVPTLIVEAKWEMGWWDPNRIEVMRKNHSHAQFEVFEKSGHVVFADEPEKFFPLLKNFLEKASKAPISKMSAKKLDWPTPPSDEGLKKVMGRYKKS